jgi:putative tricarboxylic transport membrane protein
VDVLGLLLSGFKVAMQPENILFLLLGCVVGLIIGILPGLGPMFGIALFLPLTFNMGAATALIFLTSIHAASAYGDGITSII